MHQLFRRKPISELIPDNPNTLKRVLGAGDLIMLAIGAVIGAGIFSSIGTAAAGETLPSGEIVRYGAGPALIFSFILLGIVCGLAALCYAELAAMIPQAGSAYAYSYATLGEFVAWIIGWDLILEYAVGNIAVAIAWSGYFSSLLSGFGITLPAHLTHGYRTALLSSDPAVHGLLQTAPQIAGIPDPAEHSRRAHRAGDHVAAVHRCPRERARQQRDGGRQAPRAGVLRRARRDAHRSGQLQAVRPERVGGDSPGRGDRLFCVHRLRRDLDGRRGDEEPAAQHAHRHPRRARDLHRHLRHRRHRGDRSGAVSAAQGGRPAGAGRWKWRGCRRRAGSWRSARSSR